MPKAVHQVLAALATALALMAGCADPAAVGGAGRDLREGAAGVASGKLFDLDGRGGMFVADFPLPPATLAPDPLFSPERLVDEDGTTYWASSWALPQGLQLDLGRTRRIDRVKLGFWDQKFLAAFQLLGSTDGRTWTELATRTDNATPTPDVTFAPADARYVRIVLEAWDTGSSPSFDGVYMHSVAVHGPEAPALNLARGVGVRATSIKPANPNEASMAAVKAAIDAGDAQYKARDYPGAMRAYREAYDAYGYMYKNTTDVNVAGTWAQLRMRVLAADFRTKSPGAQGVQLRKAVFLVAPEVDLSYPRAKDDDTPVHVRKRLDESQMALAKDGFFWFSETILALSGGHIRWTLEEKRLDGHKIVKARINTWDPGGGLTITPYAEDFEPPLGPTLDALHHADMFVLYWPGVFDDFQKSATHGRMDGVTINANGRQEYRAWLVSQAAGVQPYAWYNSGPYYMHETFHIIEGIYKDFDFPRGHHDFGLRATWPQGFSGFGEQDFYENVYRKHVVPADKYERFAYGSDSFKVVPRYGAYLAGDKAVDGDATTRWSSKFLDNQWLQVDLGRRQRVDRVKLSWENAHAREYRIQGYDATRKVWVNLKKVTNGDGGVDEHAFRAYSTRYLRVYCAKRGTEYGNSLWELEAYGPSSPNTNLALRKKTKTSTVE